MDGQLLYSLTLCAAMFACGVKQAACKAFAGSFCVMGQPGSTLRTGNQTVKSAVALQFSHVAGQTSVSGRK